MRDPLTIFAGGAGHQIAHAEALAAGARRHGVPVVVCHRGARPAGNQVACWGWRTGQVLRDQGFDVLVMERGYLGDRFAWTSLGWNGLNGHAEAPESPQDGGARFRQHHGALLQPWAPEGDYTLIIGQVRGDMSLQGRDLNPWYAEQATTLPGLKRFRPHPESLRRGHLFPSLPGVKMIGGYLADNLRTAALVTTWNSNAGVDAILAGKPTMVADAGSMAWGMRAQAHGSAEPPREAWAHALAWRQWTMDELTNGTAWAHVGR